MKIFGVNVGDGRSIGSRMKKRLRESISVVVPLIRLRNNKQNNSISMVASSATAAVDQCPHHLPATTTISSGSNKRGRCCLFFGSLKRKITRLFNNIGNQQPRNLIQRQQQERRLSGLHSTGGDTVSHKLAAAASFGQRILSIAGTVHSLIRAVSSISSIITDPEQTVASLASSSIWSWLNVWSLNSENCA